MKLIECPKDRLMIECANDNAFDECLDYFKGNKTLKFIKGETPGTETFGISRYSPYPAKRVVYVKLPKEEMLLGILKFDGSPGYTLIKQWNNWGEDNDFDVLYSPSRHQDTIYFDNFKVKYRQTQVKSNKDGENTLYFCWSVNCNKAGYYLSWVCWEHDKYMWSAALGGFATGKEAEHCALYRMSGNYLIISFGELYFKNQRGDNKKVAPYGRARMSSIISTWEESGESGH